MPVARAGGSSATVVAAEARADASRLASSERLRVVVLGYVVRGPLAGFAWHYLQYAVGLARMGHEVHFLEESGEHRECCYDLSRDVTDADPSYGLRFAGSVFDRVGLGERWAYFDAHTARWLGPAADRAVEIAEGADLVLNVGGVNRLIPPLDSIPVRVLIDTDPVFTQIANLTEPGRRTLSAAHTDFFSFGAGIGSAGSSVPDDGFAWRATRQPVALDLWPVVPVPPLARFTTIMQWDSYEAREHDGLRYGVKSDSFADYLDLPSRAGRRFELAVGSESAPRSLLEERGWLTRDPLECSRDPWAYQRYIQSSAAELSVAKHGYVAARSGWFSERSACYLASGRPAVLQDTGFSDWLPTGEGLFAFDSLEGALEAIDAVESDPDRHGRAARRVAEEHFDSSAVLTRLVEGAMAR